MQFTLDGKCGFVYAPPGERQKRMLCFYAAFVFSDLLNSVIFFNKAE